MALSKTSEKTKKLTLSALMIALATFDALICGLIPFLNLSFGGGITVASMLPIIIIAYIYGTKWGLFTGFVYSIFQMIIGGKTVSALFMPSSDTYSTILNAILICLIDYVIAYTLLGLGGIFKRKLKNRTTELVLGSIVALVLCYLAHVISGAIFYGAWAEWFFTDTVIAELSISKKIMETFSGAALSTVYSFVYNGCYMIPEIILTAIAAVPISMIPFIKKESL